MWWALAEGREGGRDDGGGGVADGEDTLEELVTVVGEGVVGGGMKGHDEQVVDDEWT